MMRKIFGVKSISHLIYGLLMLAPILAIVVKCAYVVINKNAKASYSGTNQNTEEIVNVSSINNFDYSKTYRLGNALLDSNVNATSSGYMFFDSVNVLEQNSTKPLNEVDRVYIYANGQTMYYNFYADTTNITYGSTENFLIEIKIRSFTGNTTAIDNLNYDLSHSTTLYYIDYFTQQQLDNVFYYAIDEIIQDNNFGKINFTGWFDNMMLDNNIQINQTYTHLFNWYLNYTLFISCAYILWLVLMWFVNFARKLLDRGMNYDW